MFDTNVFISHACSKRPIWGPMSFEALLRVVEIQDAIKARQSIKPDNWRWIRDLSEEEWNSIAAVLTDDEITTLYALCDVNEDDLQ